MYFNKEYLEQAMSERRRGNVGMFYVRIDDPAKSAPIANAIDEMFRNGTAQTKTESEQAFVVGFLSFLGNVKVMLMSFAGAVMFTVLLVSANTMAMSVRERVREVGVLKTLGFTNGAILGLVLGEACAISVIGGAIGYAISMLLMRAWWRVRWRVPAVVQDVRAAGGAGLRGVGRGDRSVQLAGARAGRIEDPDCGCAAEARLTDVDSTCV
jgi:ABC-type lipoprotein release transport system permease subunit